MESKKLNGESEFTLWLVYNMTQVFALCHVATRNAYKMIWMAKIENISIPALRAIQIIYIHFRSQHDTAQTLVSCYKPAFIMSQCVCTGKGINMTDILCVMHLFVCL